MATRRPTNRRATRTRKTAPRRTRKPATRWSAVDAIQKPVRFAFAVSLASYALAETAWRTGLRG